MPRREQSISNWRLLRRALPQHSPEDLEPWWALRTGTSVPELVEAIEDGFRLETAQELSSFGVYDLERMRSLGEDEIELLRDLFTGDDALSPDISAGYHVGAWVDSGLTAADIKAANAFLVRHVSRDDITGVDIPTLLRFLQSDSERASLARYLEAGLDVDDSVEAMALRIPIDALRRTQSLMGDANLDVARALVSHPVDKIAALRPKPAGSGAGSRNRDYISIADALNFGASEEVIRTAFAAGMDPIVALWLERTGLPIETFLPYADVLDRKNVHSVGILAWLGVPKAEIETGVTAPSDSQSIEVNRVLLDRYRAGTLPPEFAQWMEEHNISNPGRYPLGVVARLVSGYKSSDKPVAALVLAKYDHSSAFDHSEHYTQLLQGYDVHIVEVATKDEIVPALRRLSAETLEAGEKFGVIQLGGHGVSEGVVLSASPGATGSFGTGLNVLDHNDRDVFRDLRALTSPNTRLVFESCATAEEEDSIAVVAWREMGIRTIAPNTNTAIAHYILDDEGLIDSIRFSQPSHLELFPARPPFGPRSAPRQPYEPLLSQEAIERWREESRAEERRIRRSGDRRELWAD